MSTELLEFKIIDTKSARLCPHTHRNKRHSRAHKFNNCPTDKGAHNLHKHHTAAKHYETRSIRDFCDVIQCNLHAQLQIYLHHVLNKAKYVPKHQHLQLLRPSAKSTSQLFTGVSFECLTGFVSDLIVVCKDRLDNSTIFITTSSDVLVSLNHKSRPTPLRHPFRRTFTSKWRILRPQSHSYHMTFSLPGNFACSISTNSCTTLHCLHPNAACIDTF